VRVNVDQNILRVLDANFNRGKEGLRVCEDICRFVYDDHRSTKVLKDIRHQLTNVISSLKLKQLISARHIQADVGRQSTVDEFKRKEVKGVLCANFQRVKESIRVLEEMTKLFNKKQAEILKRLRYQVYALEKRVIEKS